MQLALSRPFHASPSGKLLEMSTLASLQIALHSGRAGSAPSTVLPKPKSSQETLSLALQTHTELGFSQGAHGSSTRDLWFRYARLGSESSPPLFFLIQNVFMGWLPLMPI